MILTGLVVAIVEVRTIIRVALDPQVPEGIAIAPHRGAGAGMGTDQAEVCGHILNTGKAVHIDRDVDRDRH